jgi:hypothetical protein
LQRNSVETEYNLCAEKTYLKILGDPQICDGNRDMIEM